MSRAESIVETQKVEKEKIGRNFLIALAVALDGYIIELGLGDDGNLGVEVDAEIKWLKTE